MRGIAMLLVALWGILRRMVILGFRNFSAVEEEGTRRGTTMSDAIERHVRALKRRLIQKIQFLASKSRLVKVFPTPTQLLSGVEEEETQQATASAAIVSRVEEEGSRQGTTSDDIIASHISGAEEGAMKKYFIDERQNSTVDWASNFGVFKSKFHCYSHTRTKYTLHNLTNQWKLGGRVTGLKSPWSKHFNQTSQKIEVELLMEPTVLVNNSLSLKILNLKFHSDTAGIDASAGTLSRFFLSGVALTVTPEVDPQYFMFTKLGLGSPNPAYDKLFGTTSGTSVTVPLGKGVPTVGFTSTQTISLTSKSVTDWKHEQTHGTKNCHSSKSGTFSWILKNLGRIPFDREKPFYARSFKKSRLELPFNEDGSVTFTDKEYPEPITWTFKPELEGTMVAWHISMEVYVTSLYNSRFTSAGKTRKFCFPGHLQHQLSTASMRTSLVLE